MTSGRKLDIKARDQPPPAVCGIGTRALSFITAAMFILEDAAQLYALFTNFYDYKVEFSRYVDLPLTLCIRVPAILGSFCLIYGAVKQRSTPIAVFLWTLLEVYLIYLTYFSFKSITRRLSSYEYYTAIVTIVIKAILWWCVNMYHNYLKRRGRSVINSGLY